MRCEVTKLASPRRVLHLVGSPTSEFHYDLSVVYARGCIEALTDAARYDFVIALVRPDGSWRFPASLDDADVACVPALTIEAAIGALRTARIDVALPQMFCVAGMTAYRALLDLLVIPYLGNRPAQMALTADKAHARAVVAAAGVRVPRGEMLYRGDLPTLPVPSVVKPNDADNSDGISLVLNMADYPAALAAGFAHSEAVLVEAYIALGREVRCGIVVRGDDLHCLPLEEYRVDTATRPIRTRASKLQGEGDQLTLAAKQQAEAWIVASDDPIVPAVWEAARRCHRALGCTQYSLFDFRIDPGGQPWFLEAGLYCSFSPQSVVAVMVAADGMPLDTFFAQAIEQALAPHAVAEL